MKKVSKLKQPNKFLKIIFANFAATRQLPWFVYWHKTLDCRNCSNFQSRNLFSFRQSISPALYALHIRIESVIGKLNFCQNKKKLPVQIKDNIIIESNVAIMGDPLPFVFVAIFRAGSVFRRLVQIQYPHSTVSRSLLGHDDVI